VIGVELSKKDHSSISTTAIGRELKVKKKINKN
jgi:hypothetical protein